MTTDSSYDAIIIGAGVIGAAIGYELSKTGRRADERYSVVPNDLDAVVSTMTSALGATVEPARQAPEGTT